ncbi:hypothetical protein EE612_005113 [Oryza sativa]|nr:hypothetical protein EE612_005113 [Oryza sativa]
MTAARARRGTGCGWRRTRSQAMSSSMAAGDELPTWHGCGRRRMQPPTTSSGAWLWTTEDAASGDKLWCGRRRRAPTWCSAWTAEDVATGDEPGVAHGGRGCYRQQQAWCGAW